MHSSLRDEFRRKRAALAALCERYGVASLDLFGSATTAEWRPNESDLDFVVTFRPEAPESLADRYLGLAEHLEALFGRPVDLLTARSIRNPYLRQSVDATRTQIYAA
jgi:uncharacterized protein